MQHDEVMRMIDEYAIMFAFARKHPAALPLAAKRRAAVEQALLEYKQSPDFDRDDWEDEQGL